MANEVIEQMPAARKYPVLTSEVAFNVERACIGKGVIHILGEILFIVVPFVVLFLIHFYKFGFVNDIIFEAEWSFAATILFGQTVAKIVTTVTKEEFGIVSSENIGLIVVLLLVVGIVPSMAVMLLVLVSLHVKYWLGVSQIILFCLGCASFILFGTGVRAIELMQDIARKRFGLSEWPTGLSEKYSEAKKMKNAANK